MNPHKALRFLVTEEVKALLEKIDSLDRHDSSSYPIEHLLRHGKFTRLERKLLRNAIDRVQRRQTLSDAMHVVIYGDVEHKEDSNTIFGRVDSGLQISTGTFTDPNTNVLLARKKRMMSNRD